MPAIIRRVVLVADTLTPLLKPGGSGYTQVAIGNATASVLYAYAGDTPVEDTDNYIKIPIGSERLVRYTSPRGSADVITYLKSLLGGEVTLIWG